MIWTRTESQYPPKDTPIIWIDPDGLEVAGQWLGGAVWMPDGSAMYVYYRPDLWRPQRGRCNDDFPDCR